MFLRIRTIKGGQYAYLVRSVRVTGKRTPRQEIIAYLGPVTGGKSGTLGLAKAVERAKWVQSQMPRGHEQWAREEAQRRELQAFHRWMDEMRKPRCDPSAEAEKRYMELRERNQTQIRNYWQKVEDQVERDQKANEAWKAERDASPSEPQPPSGQSPTGGEPKAS